MEVQKTFYCVFCRDIVRFRLSDFSQFQLHMETVHSVHYEHNILLAINFIERAEKDKIIREVKIKVNSNPLLVADNSSVKTEDSNEGVLKASQHMESFDANREKVSQINSEPQKYVQITSKSFLCLKCGKVCPSVKQIQQHHTDLLCHENRKFACTRCRKKFVSRRSLRYHTDLDIPCKKIINCETCGEIVKESFLEKHMKTKRCEKALDMTCRNCLRRFNRKQCARSHYRDKEMHPEICLTRITCDKCGKNVKKDRLKFHKVKKCPMISTDLKCLNCHKYFLSKRILRIHKKKPCTSRVPCGRCGKIFSDEAMLQRHTISKFSPCRPIKEVATKTHIIEDTNLSLIYTTFKCKMCDESLKTPGALQWHIKFIHNYKIATCLGCSKTFRGEAYLRQHQQRKRDCPAFDPNLVKTFDDETKVEIMEDKVK
jgi:hypothetical protein